MKFKDSLLYAMLITVVEKWKENGFYHFALNIPYIVMVLTFGVVLAIFIDIIFTMSAN